MQMTPYLLMPTSIAKRLKYERGRPQYREADQPFVGCPYLESGEELLDLLNYYDHMPGGPAVWLLRAMAYASLCILRWRYRAYEENGQ